MISYEVSDFLCGKKRRRTEGLPDAEPARRGFCGCIRGREAGYECRTRAGILSLSNGIRRESLAGGAFLMVVRNRGETGKNREKPGENRGGLS